MENMAKSYIHEIPEGYEARIEGNKVIIELRESEDEMIRKRLINLIKELATSKVPILTGGYFVDGQDKKYIAWLEKQKENPKSADSIPSDCVSDAKYEDRSPKHSDSDGTDIRDTPAYWKGWDDAMKQKEQNHPNGCFTCDEYKKGYETGRLNGFTAGYNKAMKEVDQKEQKQVWSEEDREMIDHLIEALPMWANGRIAMLPSQADEYVERLKSLRPQPKVEWSEEDESRLDHAITTLAENVKRGSAREDFEFLASLPRRFNLQPIQEWSEEDETESSSCMTK